MADTAINLIQNPVQNITISTVVLYVRVCTCIFFDDLDYIHTYTYMLCCDNKMQVCVQLPTYAGNVALPAFAGRTPPLQQSIDIFGPPGPQQRVCWDRVGQKTDGRTDEQTDTVSYHKPCYAYYAGSANNS